MVSKDELQTILKDTFGINKNISQPLNQEECERLLDLLKSEPSAFKLVQSYAEKNSYLGRNNANYGRARNQAERKLEALKTQYSQLEQSIESIETANKTMEEKRAMLVAEQKRLQADVQALSSSNQSLASKVQTLTTENDELVSANTQLKKENKDLKNIVDQIRLRLARDTKELLKYEDSQLRKAIIRLFQWTLG